MTSLDSSNNRINVYHISFASFFRKIFDILEEQGGGWGGKRWEWKGTSVSGMLVASLTGINQGFMSYL